MTCKYHCYKNYLFAADVYISRRLFDAIKTVESNGNENAVADGGKAIGPYQIHERYWIDAAGKDKDLTENGETYQNCMGPGSTEYSEKVIQAYMNKYATKARLGRQATEEDIARIHNGGPDGYKKIKATDIYWEKIKKNLQG